MSIAARPRLGFLGVGWIGMDRLDAIAASGVATVAAVADPAIAGSLGSYEALLAEDIDAVVIATPSAQHAAQTITALDRGLPVFVQKPVGRDAVEVRSVVRAARKADVLLGVDLSYRHAEAFRVAREVLPELGEVFAAELTFHNAYGPNKSWSHDPAMSGGGCVIDLGIHLVDLAVWTLGLEPQDVRSRLVGAPVERWATAELDHVHIACSWGLHAGEDARIEALFYGTDGGIRVTNVGGSFYDLRCERLSGTTREVVVEPPDDWPGRAAVRWASRVAAGERFDAAEADVLVRVAEILDRIYGR